MAAGGGNRVSLEVLGDQPSCRRSFHQIGDDHIRLPFTGEMDAFIAICRLRNDVAVVLEQSEANLPAIGVAVDKQDRHFTY